MLQGEATLPLCNESSHDYVGLPVRELEAVLLGLWISALGQFLGLKSKILLEQNVIHFQFYTRLPNFRLLGSIIIKISQAG